MVKKVFLPNAPISRTLGFEVILCVFLHSLLDCWDCRGGTRLVPKFPSLHMGPSSSQLQNYMNSCQLQGFYILPSGLSECQGLLSSFLNLLAYQPQTYKSSDIYTKTLRGQCDASSLHLTYKTTDIFGGAAKALIPKIKLQTFFSKKISFKKMRH